MTCTVCRLGRIWECESHGDCNSSGNYPGNIASGNPSNSESIAPDPEQDGPVREINTYKSDHVLRDQQSTGRKRAAEMYPLDRDAPCEWQNHKNNGGGKHPIVGCINGKQQARHHGPDKNTLNNDAGNVHRICHQCHNRWHARNDEGYVWGAVYDPHSPIVTDQQTILLDELNWIGKSLKNVVD